MIPFNSFQDSSYIAFLFEDPQPTVFQFLLGFFWTPSSAGTYYFFIAFQFLLGFFIQLLLQLAILKYKLSIPFRILRASIKELAAATGHTFQFLLGFFRLISRRRVQGIQVSFNSFQDSSTPANKQAVKLPNFQFLLGFFRYMGMAEFIF